MPKQYVEKYPEINNKWPNEKITDYIFQDISGGCDTPTQPPCSL